MKRTLAVLTNLLITLVLLPACGDQPVQDPLQSAEQALAARDYQRAVDILEAALQQDEQDPTLHYYLGQAYRSQFFHDGSQINDLNPDFAPKASAHFRKVFELDPAFEGRQFVVDPYTKVQSIWGALAMSYASQGEPDKAREAFRRGREAGGFYPAMMEYNRNMLASCAENAILFTNGDNDTYPGWYLQLMEGYRTDITIANLSLLNVPWYIRQLRDGYPFGGNNIDLGLDDAAIAGLAAIEWPPQTQTLPVAGDPLNPSGQLQWEMKPTVQNRLLRVQDQMVLEILRENRWRRPVYFAVTVYGPNKIGLDAYLAMEGLVLRLNSHKAKVDAAQLEKNLMEIYQYQGLGDSHLGYIKELRGMFQNYRAGFVELVLDYAGKGQPEREREVLAAMDRLLPVDKLPYTDDRFREKVESLR